MAITCAHDLVYANRQTMAKLRFGIVGAGMISRISCRDIAAHPEVEIVAAADPSGERLEDLASRYGISRTYADAAALFDDAEVDAVYIAVPNAFHAEMARQALAANKHTILDKPFAMNITQAQSVAEAARATLVGARRGHHRPRCAAQTKRRHRRCARR